jgi:site-specific DNA-methyltransferase (adenine-specific)
VTVRAIHGDCLDVIPQLVAEGIMCDACVTDPPYHLTATQKRFGAAKSAPAQYGRDGAMSRLSGGFMGQRWDGGNVSFRPETWATVATILRPGAFLLAFGGTRTYHRLACAIEDAGFVIQDSIAWLYGSGFPKRRDMLKPAMELICVAYKPGGKRTLGVDECRIDGKWTTWRRGDGSLAEGGNMPFCDTEHRRNPEHPAGRWPANVVHDDSDEVLAAFPDARGAISNGSRRGNGLAETKTFAIRSRSQVPGRNDDGSAARFFYHAKADAQDRAGSKHPTIKPVDLISWLVKLVTPPGGLFIDPFAGSGTAAVAAIATGRNAILVEREDNWYADIMARIAHYEGTGAHSAVAKARRAPAQPIGGLFDTGE